MIESLGELHPEIHPSAWVHATAVVIGEVRLHRDVSIWPTAVLRGDMGAIVIGAGSNVQDGTICHNTDGRSETLVGERVTIGHRAILHGCIVEDDCLIGMGAIVMDDVVIGTGSFIGAGAVVPPGKRIPPHSMVMGVPGRVVRPVNQGEAKAIRYAWAHYVETMPRYSG